MNFIDSSADLIVEENPWKKIELAGRTCYKSESKITEVSSLNFVNRIIANGHNAMLEHAVFVFRFNGSSGMKLSAPFVNRTEDNGCVYLSTNMRVLMENNSDRLIDEMRGVVNRKYPGIDVLKNSSPCGIIELVDKSELKSLTAESINKHFYTTFRFVCDRGVSHEIVRHRLCSFAQESTRYCNYNKRGITFIKPSDFDSRSEEDKAQFIKYLEFFEYAYNIEINRGYTPQVARAVLPNCLKTEIVVTANHEEWQHIFDLRYRETTGPAHPDMKRLMNKAYSLYPITSV